MNRFKFTILFVFILMLGCSTFSEKNRIKTFGTISKAYENTLRASRFETAHQFLDPEVVLGDEAINQYNNVKVYEYEVKEFNLSDDTSEIHQTAEIMYYKMDTYILRTIRDKQFWKYNETDKVWFLQTGLPAFK